MCCECKSTVVISSLCEHRHSVNVFLGSVIVIICYAYVAESRVSRGVDTYREALRIVPFKIGDADKNAVAKRNDT